MINKLYSVASSIMSKIRVVDIATIGLAVDRADIEDLRRVGKELSEAFEDIGFVFVKNHGVDEEMINDAREASKDYFLVDFENKFKYY